MARGQRGEEDKVLDSGFIRSSVSFCHRCLSRWSQEPSKGASWPLSEIQCIGVSTNPPRTMPTWQSDEQTCRWMEGRGRMVRAKGDAQTQASSPSPSGPGPPQPPPRAQGPPPSTFQAFFGVLVAEACVWGEVGLCAERKCLTADPSVWLPALPASVRPPCLAD